jgi:hypothetical protein
MSKPGGGLFPASLAGASDAAGSGQKAQKKCGLSAFPSASPCVFPGNPV